LLAFHGGPIDPALVIEAPESPLLRYRVNAVNLMRRIVALLPVQLEEKPVENPLVAPFSLHPLSSGGGPHAADPIVSVLLKRLLSGSHVFLGHRGGLGAARGPSGLLRSCPSLHLRGPLLPFHDVLLDLLPHFVGTDLDDPTLVRVEPGS